MPSVINTCYQYWTWEYIEDGFCLVIMEMCNIYGGNSSHGDWSVLWVYTVCSQLVPNQCSNLLMRQWTWVNRYKGCLSTWGFVHTGKSTWNKTQSLSDSGTNKTQFSLQSDLKISGLFKMFQFSLEYLEKDPYTNQTSVNRISTSFWYFSFSGLLHKSFDPKAMHFVHSYFLW